MASPYHIDVDDTSPSVSYFPFGDTFSTANLRAGWNPYFDDGGFSTHQGEIGNGTSSHITSHDGASLSLRWRGIGIQLVGNSTGASLTITLDGTPSQTNSTDSSNNILATFHDLNDTDHTITLTVGAPVHEDSSESHVIVFNKAVITTVIPPESSPNPTFTSLPDSDIAFFGQWTFNNSSHHSSTQGDNARTRFTGASFLLTGMTSPSSGNYSVTLDNVTTILSARSSFTKSDSLLFFATGLDPEATHNVEVVNDDGSDLSLKATGFSVYAAGAPTSAAGVSEPMVSATSVSYSKGTIAALVLAGILAFLLLCGLLFYCFVVRPRKRRKRRAGRERRTKECETGKVLDIAPDLGNDVGPWSTEANVGHRVSGRSGFTRWKREVEGGLGGFGLGISFRHSESTGEKGSSRYGGDDAESEPLSTKSSAFTASPKRNKGKAKKEVKAKNVSDGSGSHSFTLEFPLKRPSSGESLKASDQSPLPQGPYSPSSGVTSLSYMSTPPTFKHPPLLPPSYSESDSNRRSHTNSNSNSGPHSVPRSVSHSPQPPRIPSGHTRKGSRGSLLRDADTDHGANDDRPLENDTHVATLSVPVAQPHTSFLNREERGSAQYSTDDGMSILGPAAARNALRALRPRTSEMNSQRAPDIDITGPSGERRNRHKMHSPAPKTLQQTPPEQTDTELSTDHHELEPKQEQVHDDLQESRSNDDMRPLVNLSLDLRPTSPFKVDFQMDVATPQHSQRQSGGSYVHFEQGSGQGTSNQEKGKVADEQPAAEQSRKMLTTGERSWFRLTPPSLHPPTFSRRRSESTSFLDFSSSSDASVHNHSVEYSNSERDRTSSIPMSRLRWSQATFLTQKTNLTRSESHSASIPPLGTVQISQMSHMVSQSSPPTSSHLPDSQNRPYSTRPQITYTIHQHPLAHEPPLMLSPTESLPMTVSDIQFGHRDSIDLLEFSPDSTRPNSQLPPHPPLPRLESQADTPGLTATSYIVQRVLGHTPTQTITGPVAGRRWSNSDIPTPRPSPAPWNDLHKS